MENWKKSSEKDAPLFATLLASGLADKVGEHINKLESVACHFTKPGGHRLPRIVIVLVTN